MIKQLIMCVFFLLTSCGGDGTMLSDTSVSDLSDTIPELPDTTMPESPEVIPVLPSFTASLLFPDGIEPGDPGDCEAASPNRCWWVDADAPDGGDGSFANPYNSFEVAVGYRQTSSYTAGLLQGGDHIYLKGTFDADNQIDSSVKSIQLYIGRSTQGGTKENPTVIKSYKGTPRAIFDGKFKDLDSFDTALSAIIHIASAGTPIGAIKIQNIEVQNAHGIGISFVENVLYAEVAGVVVHDTGLRDGASSRGGIHFRMTENKTEFIVRNSLFYNNFRNEGGSGFFAASSNNIGGINILSSDEAEDGSKITIKDNILLNEFYAIRHKKSGNIETEISTNVIDTAKMGFYVRGYRDNIFQQNLVRNISDSVVYLDAEFQHGPMQVKVWNNTVTESVRFINTGFEDVGLARTLDVQNNIFSSSVERFPIALSRDPSNDDYDLNQWSSNNNIFNISGVTILKNKGTEYNFVDSMALLNDMTSFTGDPLFVSEAAPIATPVTNIANTLMSVLSADYSLNTGSPALNTDSNGNNIGAIQ